MQLAIVHFHFRPGGVRRVIELAAPFLARTLRPGVDRIVLIGGEAPDDGWLDNFRRLAAPLPVTVRVRRAFGYDAGGPLRLETVRGGLRAEFAGADPDALLVWAHNPGLGRNLLLARALVDVCAAREIRLVFHHHDWWFDNRWRRWAEMRRAGFRTLAAAAAAVFATARNVRHAAINRADAAILERHLPGQAGWLPNPGGAQPPPAGARVRTARAWLHRRIGEKAPVWLMPCRLLRRKNIAEALLLTRWLRPEAWLVTTAGASSPDEQPYAQRLAAAARRHGWRLQLGVLDGGGRAAPTVAELIAASEALLMTSLQEGFGLPYLEAAMAGRPLLARSIPNIAPDLAQFGFRFPQYYDEVLVDPALFDGAAERARQRRLLRSWRRHLPAAWRHRGGTSPVLAAEADHPAIPFSRLTLAAQLEVLARPVAESWGRCAPLNPFLRTWRRRAAGAALRVTPWPRRADDWLGEKAYARRFARLVAESTAPAAPRRASRAAQEDFMRNKIAPEHQYPLLWDRDL